MQQTNLVNSMLYPIQSNLCNTQRSLTLRDLKLIQHWVSQIGLFLFALRLYLQQVHLHFWFVIGPHGLCVSSANGRGKKTGVINMHFSHHHKVNYLPRDQQEKNIKQSVKAPEKMQKMVFLWEFSLLLRANYWINCLQQTIHDITFLNWWLVQLLFAKKKNIGCKR